jgi:hypothetical protein
MGFMVRVMGGMIRAKIAKKAYIRGSIFPCLSSTQPEYTGESQELLLINSGPVPWKLGGCLLNLLSSR